MVVSPDGALTAYTSDESGRYEVYLRSFPEPGAQTVVSQGGGVLPSWSPDGNALYYGVVDVDLRWMVARIGRAPVPTVLSTDALSFTLPGTAANPIGASMLHPDGDRFIVGLDAAASDAAGAATGRRERLVLVQNWLTEVRERMGVARRD